MSRQLRSNATSAKPNQSEVIAMLQMALTQSLDQNELLRHRIIELQALLVAAQQLNEETLSKSKQKNSRCQPPRAVKKRFCYRKMLKAIQSK